LSLVVASLMLDGLCPGGFQEPDVLTD